MTVSADRAISLSLEHLWAMFLDIARGTNRADVCHGYGRAVATLLQDLGSYPRVGKRHLCTGSPILLLHRPLTYLAQRCRECCASSRPRA